MVEDDVDVRRSVVRRLRHDGFAVDEADRADAADHAVLVHPYDCLVVDRRLPDGDGLDMVGRWRADGVDTFVLFITARGTPADRVQGLDVGDDYLAKPFGLDEMAARVRALCRRGVRPRLPVLRCGDVEVDLGAREVRRGGVRLFLTPKEFAVLEVLLDEPGAVVSKEELFERCWDERVEMIPRSVIVHVSSLRRKLGDPPLIRTVRGGGYVLDAPG